MSVFKREDAVGKTVVTQEGKIFGQVKDIGFRIDGSVVLIVTRGDGKEESIPLKDIAGMSDYVVLKPVYSPITQQEHTSPPGSTTSDAPRSPTECPNCANPLRVGAKFCPKCGTKI